MINTRAPDGANKSKKTHMCLIPKAVHMMVDANAANGDGVVRCGEVRRSEKIVRREKEK